MIKKSQTAAAVNKPNSVPATGYPGAGNDHSSGSGGCPSLLATYPETRTGRPQAFPYLVLHQVGFAKLPRSPGELVRSYRTVSPLPQKIYRSKSANPSGRFTFCCTFLRVTATPRYGAPCPVVFGLSSGAKTPPAIV